MTCEVTLEEPALTFAISPFSCPTEVILEALVEMQPPVSLVTKGEQEWLGREAGSI